MASMASSAQAPEREQLEHTIGWTEGIGQHAACRKYLVINIQLDN